MLQDACKAGEAGNRSPSRKERKAVGGRKDCIEEETDADQNERRLYTDC